MSDQEARQALAEARASVRREGLALKAAAEIAEDALLRFELAQRTSDRAIRAFVAASVEVAP